MTTNQQTLSKIPEVSNLDADLSSILKDTQNAFQSLIKTRKELRSCQLESRITRDQLQSARQRLESHNLGGNSSDWNKFSKSLNNIIKVVNERKDIVEYEQTIRKLSEENESLKKQIDVMRTDYEEALDKQKMDLQKRLDKEIAQHAKQISELTIDKELAASEASIKYDQLQSLMERLKSENEDRCKAIVTQYEKLVQSLSSQKHKLRDENVALQRREMELRDHMEHLQNHSTGFMMGMGPRISPIGGSQRYAEVVETFPILGPRIESNSQQSSQIKSIRSEKSVAETVEVSSSSNSNTRTKNHSSPQHPGVGGHVAKPRRKRKLFTQTSGEL